jgi:hypothetical protein
MVSSPKSEKSVCLGDVIFYEDGCFTALTAASDGWARGHSKGQQWL